MMRLSGVFENMIESASEQNEAEDGTDITINGVDPDIFKKIMK